MPMLGSRGSNGSRGFNNTREKNKPEGTTKSHYLINKGKTYTFLRDLQLHLPHCVAWDSGKGSYAEYYKAILEAFNNKFYDKRVAVYFTKTLVEKIIGIKPNSFEHYGISFWFDTEVKNLGNSTYFWTVKVKILKFYKCNCSSKKREQPLPFKHEIQIMRQTEVWKDERKK